MTKKQNKRHEVRQLRRNLSRTWDPIRGVGNGIHRTNYGSGVDTRQLTRIGKEIEHA